MRLIQKILALIAITSSAGMPAEAAGPAALLQTKTETVTPATPSAGPNWFVRNGVLNSMDVAVTAGTAGLGLEIAAPVTRWVQVRAGLEWMPRFSVPMSFGLTAYSGSAINDGNFSKVQDLMHDLTGFDIDQTIDVDGKPTMTQFKFLVDVYPFRNNRHWHFTAGFFAGGCKMASVCNTMGEMPGLVSMGLYNRLHDYVLETDFMDTPIFTHPTQGDIYLDPDVADELKARMEEYGRLGAHIGDYKDGTPYIMEPGSDGTVRANAFVDNFRPYLGLGYGGAASADKRLKVSVEAGVMFWGGAPKVITHEGVNMTDDLINVRGKVGDYLDLVKGLKVYPIVEFRLSYTLF